MRRLLQFARFTPEDKFERSVELVSRALECGSAGASFINLTERQQPGMARGSTDGDEFERRVSRSSAHGKMPGKSAAAKLSR